MNCTSFLVAAVFLWITGIATGQTSSLLQTDFESGIGDWFVDNGLWEVGVPSAGPDMAFSGQHAAGTVLNGNYPVNANTRLISPAIDLPTVTADQEIRLRFWHWFSFASGDNGVVQLSVDNGEWQTLSTVPFDGSSITWTQFLADITAFAGSSVRVGFLLRSDSNPNSVSTGWYVDDVFFEGVNTTTSRERYEVLSRFALHGSYPNPFHHTITIPFDLPLKAEVILRVFDAVGREIGRFDYGLREAARRQEVVVDGGWLASGTYFFSLEVRTHKGLRTKTGSFTLLR